MPRESTMCRCDGIGRHRGFKIPRLCGRGGSSPPTGTTLFQTLVPRGKPRIIWLLSYLTVVPSVKNKTVPMHITRRQATYYFQRKIPLHLQAYYDNKPKIYFSLKTKDRKEAERLARLESVRIDNEFAGFERDQKASDAVTQNDLYAIAVQEAQAIIKEAQDKFYSLSAEAQGDYLRSLSDAKHVVCETIADSKFTALHIQETIDELIGKYRLPGNLSADKRIKLTVKFLRLSVTAYEQLFREFDRPWDKNCEARLENAKRVKSMETTLSDLITQFMAEKKELSLSHKNLYETSLAALEATIGGATPVSRIVRKNIREYRDNICSIPSHSRKHKETKNLSLDALFKASREGKFDHLGKLATKTVKDYLTTVTSLFSFAVAEGLINNSPCVDIQVKDTEKAKDKRPPFSPEAVKRLLEITDREDAPMRWATRISLTMGLRMEEVLRLTKRDVLEVEGVRCLSVNEDDETKSVKTTSSIRVVPIPQVILDDGWLSFVERSGDELFKVTVGSNGKKSTPFSKRYSYFLKKHGLKAPRVSFHSLRHNFRDGFRHAEISKELAIALGGWTEKGDVSDSYGSGFTVHQKKEALDKLKLY